MHQVTIQYANPKALEVLKAFAGYFDFSISILKKKKKAKAKKTGKNEIAFLSEESLAEAWNSPEDERRDELYEK